MQAGKIQDNILKRSVTNIIGKGIPEGKSPGVGKDCGFSDNGGTVICQASGMGSAEGAGPALAVFKAANNVWAAGGKLCGFQSVFFLSEDTKEAELKELTRKVKAAADACKAPVNGGHTEVSPDVKKPVVAVSAAGISGKYRETGPVPGDYIMVTKWVGLGQMAMWLSDENITKSLEERFCRSYIDTIRDCGNWLAIYDEAETAKASGAKLMHDVSGGGIFTALFEMSERFRTGFEADLKKIPVRQEIMEASTFLKVNPYRMDSTGSLIIVCDDPDMMMGALAKEEIPSAVIGRFTDNNDKIIRNGEDISFLARK